ncbi:MAG: SWIM zinc finger family protein, partial [Syntrophobacteraceae bacterium]
MSWRNHEYFPPSRPKAVKGGIKAQSKRGGFGESWWAKRWIAVLEGFNIGARLGRGRSYARRGQVLSIDIQKGVVKARVQGSRTKPYEIAIKVKPLSQDGWKKLAKALSSQVIFVAKLLSGEMPQDIERVFNETGLSLFPEKLKDLETNCSCPDWSNPCKHIAAVYYLLGEEFDRNPFLIFKLRGMEREELLAGLGEMDKGGNKAKSKGTDRPPEALPPVEPINADAQSFW